jgi:hypothetical protein
MTAMTMPITIPAVAPMEKPVRPTQVKHAMRIIATDSAARHWNDRKRANFSATTALTAIPV